MKWALPVRLPIVLSSWLKGRSSKKARPTLSSAIHSTPAPGSSLARSLPITERSSSMSRLVYVLNGPNLNLLGKRQPHIYGHETLADVERDCRALAGELALEVRFHQSNREYELIDWIHEARETAGGIVMNPAAFTHTSVAILDALNTFEAPVIECHI